MVKDGEDNISRDNTRRTWTLTNRQRVAFEFHLRSSPSAFSGYEWSVDQLITSLPATQCWRDPTRSKQLSTVAILGFQFGLYHVVVSLASYLRKRAGTGLLAGSIFVCFPLYHCFLIIKARSMSVLCPGFLVCLMDVSASLLHSTQMPRSSLRGWPKGSWALDSDITAFTIYNSVYCQCVYSHNWHVKQSPNSWVYGNQRFIFVKVLKNMHVDIPCIPYPYPYFSIERRKTGSKLITLAPVTIKDTDNSFNQSRTSLYVTLSNGVPWNIPRPTWIFLVHTVAHTIEPLHWCATKIEVTSRIFNNYPAKSRGISSDT